MTSRRASNVVPLPDAAIQSLPQREEPKFTWNIRVGDESLTVRTSNLDELTELREKFRDTFKTPDGATVYHIGDKCPKCNNVLAKKNGRSGPFLGCVGYRDGCIFTARYTE